MFVRNNANGSAIRLDTGNDQTWQVTISDWTSIWGTIDKKKFDFQTVEDENIANKLNQPSFWLGGMHDFQVKGSYKIRFFPDENVSVWTHVDITGVNLAWRWVDRVGAIVNSCVWENFSKGRFLVNGKFFCASFFL